MTHSIQILTSDPRPLRRAFAVPVGVFSHSHPKAKAISALGIWEMDPPFGRLIVEGAAGNRGSNLPSYGTHRAFAGHGLSRVFFFFPGADFSSLNQPACASLAVPGQSQAPAQVLQRRHQFDSAAFDSLLLLVGDPPKGAKGRFPFWFAFKTMRKSGALQRDTQSAVNSCTKLNNLRPDLAVPAVASATAAVAVAAVAAAAVAAAAAFAAAAQQRGSPRS